MTKTAKIFIAGHRGLVGSAIVRRLQQTGYTNLITRTHSDLDLTDQQSVAGFFAAEKPDFVFLAAAKVGGIMANATRPAEFIYDNLLIEANVIHAAWASGVRRLLFLGSTCIYPKAAPQPMQEEHLLTGPLEPTNEAYAVAKIAGVKMCQAYNRQYGTRFLSAMPTNLYGPGDNFDLETSHVLPALIRKFHEAKAKGKKEVVVWGTGTPRREFLHVDDLAAAACHLLNLHDDDFSRLLALELAPALVNVGSGRELTIRELAALVQKVIGYKGEVVFDATKPDGTPRKLTDISRIRKLGWEPAIGLEEGIRGTYEWFMGFVGKR